MNEERTSRQVERIRGYYDYDSFKKWEK